MFPLDDSSQDSCQGHNIQYLDFSFPFLEKGENLILACFSLTFVEKVSVWHFGTIVLISLEYGWHPTLMFCADDTGRTPSAPIAVRLASLYKSEPSATNTDVFLLHAIYIHEIVEVTLMTN